MDRPTLKGLLYANADEIHGRWYFRDGGEHGRTEYGHTEEEALQIVEACTSLGVPITDRVTAGAWSSLVRRVVELERGSNPYGARRD